MNKDKQQLYTSPEVNVVEIKARKVLCESPSDNGINDLTRDDNTSF